MTDEPNNPIDEPADSGVGQADAPLTSTTTGDSDAPPAVEQGSAEMQPEATDGRLAASVTEELAVTIEQPDAQSEDTVAISGPEAADVPAELEPIELCIEPGSVELPAEPQTAEVPAEPQTAEVPAEPEPAEVPAEPEPAEVPAEPEPAEVPVEAVATDTPEEAESIAAGEEDATTTSDQPDKSDNMDWYILKVQSNREDTIREGLSRRVAIAGLDRFFGEIIVPTEQITEFKAGKKRVMKRKLYPGYLVVQMEINDDTWFLVRETPGIGDFTGATGHPTPMLPHEVSRILAKQEEKMDKAPKLKIGFSTGDQVKINEGTFENFEGEVHAIDETNGRVTVMINIFGRSTPVELDYWQIGAV